MTYDESNNLILLTTYDIQAISKLPTPYNLLDTSHIHSGTSIEYRIEKRKRVCTHIEGKMRIGNRISLSQLMRREMCLPLASTS